MTQPRTYLARSAHNEPPPHAPNAALLIDFDNVTMGIRSDLQTELKRLLQSEIIRGKVAVQRAYADWRRYPQYMVPLAEASIDTIQATAYGSSKKNATDIRLAVDAMELVFTRPEIGTYILLSGDSDFSSLVLKLKEYGKYVIGVGIRESSSDLLVMNCDEYYSYNELAGLTKESDVTHVRHDPWELVVEAVKQMTAHNDVMRSDRLKQVMQEIDPTFNEKDVGFSRFSKFVVEAAHKGLISLTKLDNGQYEIALGPNVPGAAAQPPYGGRPEAPREERVREPRGGGGRRDDSRAGSRKSRFSLGEAFGLLKQALSRMGGGAQPVDAEQLREAMIELKGGEAEPLEAERFPKLLRQAHDAEIIDLSKEPDGAYEVKLREEPPPVPVAPAASFATPEPVAAGDLDEVNDPPMPQSSAPPPLTGVPARSARFRRGSRGGGPRVAPPEIPKIGVVEVDPNFKPRIELLPPLPRPAATAPPGGEAAPAPGPFDEGRRERGERGERGGRGGRGRGGRGRRGSGGGASGEAGARAEGEHVERGERGGRSRRGGRGRGGRGRNGEDRGEHRDASEPRAAAEPMPPAPSKPAPSSAPTPPPADEAEDQGGGESFWSKVKRGLTGGA
ncbi:MAG TPA: NYN domain-containing protein [Gemmatimonadales bacterium]